MCEVNDSVVVAWGIYECVEENAPEKRTISNEILADDGALYASLSSAYRDAVPHEALVAAEGNAWHVKVLNAVIEYQQQLEPFEAQLVCANTSTFASVYIYSRIRRIDFTKK